MLPRGKEDSPVKCVRIRFWAAPDDDQEGADERRGQLALATAVIHALET